MSQTESNNQSFIFLLITMQPRVKKETNVTFSPQRTAWVMVRWMHWGGQRGGETNGCLTTEKPGAKGS